MAKIYLSSTFNDLKACREAVYHVLRQMRHDVIAMEDYVAADERPIEKCLADVAASDLYIGIFAWRYGHIPSEMNSKHKSITELEYHKATQEGKTCLIFVLAKDAPWPSTAMDAITGEGNRGEYITALRDELVRERIIKFFKTPEELASSVSTSVSNWENSRSSAAPSNVLPSSGTEPLGGIQREERLKALTIDHSGFIQSRLESFVGREQELATIRQDINLLLPTGGYLTITGQPGQGKSSIIARLVQDSHPNEVAHHFIPFNPGPDHQVSLLRDLMAQLILKYDLGDYYVASESRPALRDFFPKVLGVIAAKGIQEVIFIDGLDQLREDADGERDLSFLPDNPPQGIVFVLGTRPNETLQPLELRKPHHPYRLPSITRHDFDLILQHRNARLEPGLADRFYKTMGENALYLDLVAKELAYARAMNPEELIERIADDPENIFTLSTTRLKRHAVEWREVLKPLLGVLLVAREPLTGRQLRSILVLDDQRLREGIVRLGGLVADDGKQRYSLFHLKLYDYLRQDEERPLKAYIFARDEEESWHDTLARWCERGGLSLIWEDARHVLTEQGRREYARKHFVTHLYLSQEWQLPQQRLFAVLDDVQYGQSKIRDDPSTRAYALDLDLGRQATTWEGWTLEEGVAFLPHLWQYTLLRCSLTSRADRYPEEAFRLLVSLGRKQDAIGLAELLTDQAKKVRVLQHIALQLREQANEGSEWLELLMRASDVARTIQDSDRQAWALSALGLALAQTQQWEQASQQWERAKHVIATMQDNYQQAWALRALGLALAQTQQWTEAERVITSIPDSSRQAEALSALGTALAEAQQWTEAERVITSIPDSYQQAWALSALGLALAQAQQWEQAEHVIATIQHSDQQAEALSALGTALAQAQQWEQASQAWEQAEHVIATIQHGYQQAWAFSALITTLTQAQQWERAEGVIATVQHGYQQAWALRALGLALAQAQQWERAERVIATIQDRYQQAEALSALGLALGQAQQWTEAERVIISIPDSDEQAWALMELGIALAQAQQWEQASQAWEQAERVIATIQDNDTQAEALRALGTALAQAQQWTEAERIIASIRDNSRQAEALGTLGIALAQAQQREQASQAWKRAEHVIATMQDSVQRAETLKVMGTTLAQAQQWEQASLVWEQAEHVIATMQDSSQQAETLRELSTALAQAQQWEQASQAWEQAERVIATIRDSDTQAEAISALGLALAQAQQWTEAERVIATIRDSVQQTEALKVMGTALAQAQQWEQASQAWEQAERVITSIQDSDTQAKASRALGLALAQAQQWTEAERIIASIRDSSRQAGALRELGIALAQPQQWTEAERVIATIRDSDTQAGALRELGLALAQAQQWTEAERVITSIQDSDTQAEALSVLGLALAQAQQWTEAERVITSIRDSVQQAEALRELETAMASADEFEPLLHVIQHAWRQVEKRAEAFTLFSLAKAFISHKPQVAVHFFDAFTWVDTFLGG